MSSLNSTGASDAYVTATTPTVPLPPLLHPHPLDPANGSMIQARLDSLAALAVSAEQAVNQDAPSILSSGSPQLLMYRVMLRSGLPRAVQLPNSDPIMVPIMLSSDMGLYRSVDFDEQVNLEVSAFLGDASMGYPDQSLSNVSGFLTVTPNIFTLDPKGKAVLPLLVTFPSRLPSTATHNSSIWIHLKPANNNRVVPLLTGPIAILSEDSPDVDDVDDADELISPSMIRTFPITTTLPVSSVNHVLTCEESDAGIHGRLWDSALVLCDALSGLLSSRGFNQNVRVPKILDLGCGTGTVGLLIASMIQANVVLSDIPECLSLARKNLEANKSSVAAVSSKVCLQGMWWGDLEAVRQLGTFDLIIAADVVYETEYFEDLMATLSGCCAANSEIWLVYKRRGLSMEEEVDFFEKMDQRFTNVTDESLSTNERGGVAALGTVASQIGCYLRIYRK
ncbi:putative methyltransferase-domain-containing protein [Chytriomyces cf. hyalinus JEL632]|nr:putative methyltransferase-domain-containing protein [Chytriomyces cf. hyalinus JEL632]